VDTLHWGCNADFQQVLANNLIYDQIVSLGTPYNNFVERLLKLGLFGLEQYHAAENLIRYVISYKLQHQKQKILCQLDPSYEAHRKLYV
jgi:hypothetical protein